MRGGARRGAGAAPVSAATATRAGASPAGSLASPKAGSCRCFWCLSSFRSTSTSPPTEFFFGPRNLSLLLRQASIVAVVAAGVSILIVMGEIDLSIGSAVYLCSVLAATLQLQLTLPTVPTVAITVVAGIVMAACRAVGRQRRRAVLHRHAGGLLVLSRHRLLPSDARTIAPVSEALFSPQRGVHPAGRFLCRMGAVLLIAVALFGRFYALRVSERGSDPGWLMLGSRPSSISIGLLTWVFGGSSASRSPFYGWPRRGSRSG